MEDVPAGVADDRGLTEQWRFLDTMVDRLATSLRPEEPPPLPVAGTSEDIDLLRRRVAILEQENDELLDVVVAQTREIEQLHRTRDEEDRLLMAEVTRREEELERLRRSHDELALRLREVTGRLERGEPHPA